jgi:hypothetical protein
VLLLSLKLLFFIYLLKEIDSFNCEDDENSDIYFINYVRLTG